MKKPAELRTFEKFSILISTFPTFAPRNEKTNLSLFTSAMPEFGFLTRFPAFF
jgi:hypothetical protein